MKIKMDLEQSNKRMIMTIAHRSKCHTFGHRCCGDIPLPRGIPPCNHENCPGCQKERSEAKARDARLLDRMTTDFLRLNGFRKDGSKMAGR